MSPSPLGRGPRCGGEGGEGVAACTSTRPIRTWTAGGDGAGWALGGRGAGDGGRIVAGSTRPVGAWRPSGMRVGFGPSARAGVVAAGRWDGCVNARSGSGWSTGRSPPTAGRDAAVVVETGPGRRPGAARSGAAVSAGLGSGATVGDGLGSGATVGAGLAPGRRAGGVRPTVDWGVGGDDRCVWPRGVERLDWVVGSGAGTGAGSGRLGRAGVMRDGAAAGAASVRSGGPASLCRLGCVDGCGRSGGAAGS